MNVMRHLRGVFGGAAVLAALAPAVSHATLVPRAVFAEEFGFTT